ncbi:helix-turn-helix domain-containing protein [Streptomyces sp. 1222.5]|uniref:helix-turn-helix domain-containing protein n=1 Tax=Streptomyces sp. 1222.5 TaxID=1881026 RepID=UPI003EC0A5E1
MTDEQRRRGPAATQVEATGQAVRDNVQRLRKARGLTTYQLAQKLAEIGRPIPQSGISRIESGARRVDVDDLTALALALGVSPSALLITRTLTPDEAVGVTGVGEVPALAAWDWADGLTPLVYDPKGNPNEQYREYELFGRPAWLVPLRPAGRNYTREQMEAYRAEGRARGSYEPGPDGKPRWSYPPGTEGVTDE